MGDRQALEPLNCSEMGCYRKPDLPPCGLPGGGMQVGTEGWPGFLQRSAQLVTVKQGGLRTGETSLRGAKPLLAVGGPLTALLEWRKGPSAKSGMRTGRLGPEELARYRQR